MSVLHTGYATLIGRSLCGTRLDPSLLRYHSAISRLFYLFSVNKSLTLMRLLDGYIGLITRRYLPESPRWLMSQGRFSEVKSIMKTCAKINGKEFPEHLLPQLEVMTVLRVLV